MNTVKEALLRCSFCGKTQKQVKKLIAGPGVYICDECIDLCNEIIEEELSENMGHNIQIDQQSASKGKISITYSSKDERESIISKLFKLKNN